jgi:CrcB protein
VEAEAVSGVTSWLLVALGGAIGALLRASVYRGTERLSPSGSRGLLNRLGVPRATIVANGLGALALGFGLGWLTGAETSAGPPEWPRLFWATGVCGSLTTFSTFCAEAVGLARQGAPLRLGAYVLANLVVSGGGLIFGLALAS